MLDIRPDIDRVLSSRTGSWLMLALAYMAWCVGDAADVLVAFSADHYRIGTIWISWKPAFPWVPWVIGGAGIAIGFARSLRANNTVDPESMKWGGVFVASAVVARCVSLLDPVGYVFPWLGLLWSPAATWSTGLFAAVWAHLHSISIGAARFSASRSAVLVFVFFSITYTTYGVYFARTTELHGDEAQYLLITQSLLEDGDIDLADADEDRKLAFHAFDFGIHRAPASPPGRLHSTHPVGLPALLMLPYVVGGWLGSHPRLGAVLFQCLLTAGACGLSVLFLCRQGFSVRVSTATTFVLGLSVPMFTQSTQLYPEIPAVLITLFVLILFPKPTGVPNEVDVSVRNLVLVSLAIVILPFFHQRHLILAILLTVPILTTIRRGGITSDLAKSVMGVFTFGLVAHLAYNWHYSGDVWGPFMPGNADTIDPDWTKSPFGQWIDVREGLLRHAPIYAVAILGGLRLAYGRDKRLLIVIAIFVATAGVNTLSTDWTFGFCYPSRFMVSAMPALILVTAMGVEALLSRGMPAGIWMALFAWWMGIETVLQNLVSPELGFEGMNLVSRISESFYPLSLHYINFVSGDELGMGVAVFWVLMILAMGLSHGSRGLRRSGVAIAAITPLLVSFLIPYSELLDSSRAYRVPRFTEDVEEWHHNAMEVSLPMRRSGKGVFRSSMPVLFRGAIDVLPILEPARGGKGVRAFYTLLLSGGLSKNGTRYTVPLINSETQSHLRFLTSGSAIAKQHVYPLGNEVNPLPTGWTTSAVRKSWSATVFDDPIPKVAPGAPVSMTLAGFKAGDYALRLEREGASWSEWVERAGSRGNVVAVFTGFDRVRTDAEGLAKMANRWLEEGWRDLNKPLPKIYFPPQVEARIPYFWSLLPKVLDQSAVRFTLETDGPIHIVVLPDPAVRVTGIRIDRVIF